LSTAIQVIEQRTRLGAYDKPATEAIIHHPKHGRLYVSEAFGGLDTLAGGNVRWRHGDVCRVLEGDTLESLHHADDSGAPPIHYDMIGGADKRRPVLCWSGRCVESIAKSAGLA
jgi:hypothetical protein